MSKLLGYYAGPRPFWQLRRRMVHDGVMGAYEVPGVLERQHTPFELGQRHLAGFGADTSPSYDLSAPGRVQEVKKAMKVLGQAAATPYLLPFPSDDIAKESLWAQLTDDDVWDDAASDEFVAFLSRWAPRYLCYAVPLYVYNDGLVQPTTNGLLLLDVALRYQSAGLFDRAMSAVQACGYGASAPTRLDLFESAILGAGNQSGSVDLNPSTRNNVKVLPTTNIAPHPVAPSDGDSTLYSKWKAEDALLRSFYEQLLKAPLESSRSEILSALQAERGRKDDIARAIIAAAPGRVGQTTVVCGDPNDFFDPKQDRCVPKPKIASIAPGWLVAGGLALAIGVVLFRGESPKRRRAA